MERPPNATAAPTIICRRVGSLASIPRLLLSLIVTSWILNCGPPPAGADACLVVSAGFAKRLSRSAILTLEFEIPPGDRSYRSAAHFVDVQPARIIRSSLADPQEIPRRLAIWVDRIEP